MADETPKIEFQLKGNNEGLNKAIDESEKKIKELEGVATHASKSTNNRIHSTVGELEKASKSAKKSSAAVERFIGKTTKPKPGAGVTRKDSVSIAIARIKDGVTIPTVGKQMQGFEALKGKREAQAVFLNNLRHARKGADRNSVGDLMGLTEDVSYTAPTRAEKLTEKFKKLKESVAETVKQFKRVIMYRTLRSVLKGITDGLSTGVQNLYQWSKLGNGAFASAMDKIATSMQYLTNAVGALVGPIIQDLAPVLDFVVDLFVKLTEQVSKFYAILTGKDGYYKATKQAKEYLTVQRQLMGFDVINKLDTSSDTSSMFEKVSLWGDDTFSSILANGIVKGDWNTVAESLNTKLDTVFSKVKDFVINRVGAAFNALTNTLALLDWTGLGRKILGFLTKMFGAIDFKAIFTALANFANGIITSLGDEFKNADWKQLGQSIADGIEAINWNNMISVFANALKGLATALWTALKSLWASFTETDFFKNFITLSIASDIYEAGGGYVDMTELQNTIFGEKKAKIGVQTRALGGTVNTGSLFLAGEAGPELVGQFGGKSTVFNTTQLTAELSGANEGVINAVLSAANAIVNAVDNQPAPTIKIGDRDIYSASQRGARLTGNSLIQGV